MLLQNMKKSSDFKIKEGIYVEDVQKILFECLKWFSDFCETHKINYCLDGGTLLGAVRHNGFIPWDDDVDIVMLRKDYKHFIKAMKQYPNENYKFECIENSKSYEYNFGKIKIMSTHAVEILGEQTKSIKSLWIDVFPLDNTNSVFYKLQKRISQMWQYVRWKKIGYRGNPKHKKTIAFLAKIVPVKLVNVFANLSLRFLNGIKTKNVCKICHPGNRKLPHSRSFYTEITKHEFCFHDDKVTTNIPLDYVSWLNMRYGDNWNELPPIESRKPSHTLVELKI